MKKIFFIGIVLMGSYAYSKEDSARYENYNHAQLVLPKIDYSLRMESRGMFCEAIVNNVIMVSNMRSINGLSSSVFTINEWIKNGINDFGINVASWNWIDKDTRDTYTEKEKNKFPLADSYCSLALELTTFKLHDNGAFDRVTEVVSKVVASLDKEGNLIIDKESFDFNDKRSPSISLKKENHSPINTGFRKGITNLYLINRSFEANNVPDWLWSSAKKYENIPNNRKLLEEAYRELWGILKNKDKTRLKNALAISAYENIMGARLMDVSLEDMNDFLEQAGYNDVFFDNLDLDDISFSHFNPVFYANGSIVMLQSEESFSPIKNKKGGSIVHYFSFIDGRFRIVR